MAENYNGEKNNNIKSQKIKEESKSSNSYNKKIISTKFKRKKNINKKQFLNKKKYSFKIEEFDKNKVKLNENFDFKDNIWSKEEQNNFLEGINKYGTNWKKFKYLIRTRTSEQVKSYVHKFFRKMKKCKDKNLGIDFTLDSINCLKDMIEQIKSVNILYNIKNVFMYLSMKYDIKKLKKKIKYYNTNLLEKYDKINTLNLLENNGGVKNLILDEKQKKEKELIINNNINNNYNNFYNFISLNDNLIVNLLNQLYVNLLINDINLQNQLNSYNINNLMQNDNSLHKNILNNYKNNNNNFLPLINNISLNNHTLYITNILNPYTINNQLINGINYPDLISNLNHSN